MEEGGGGWRRRRGGAALLDVGVNLYRCCSCGTEFDLSVLSSAFPLQGALPSIPPSLRPSLTASEQVSGYCRRASAEARE